MKPSCQPCLPAYPVTDAPLDCAPCGRPALCSDLRARGGTDGFRAALPSETRRARPCQGTLRGTDPEFTRPCASPDPSPRAHVQSPHPALQRTSVGRQAVRGDGCLFAISDARMSPDPDRWMRYGSCPFCAMTPKRRTGDGEAHMCARTSTLAQHVSARLRSYPRGNFE